MDELTRGKDEDYYRGLREDMVTRQIERRGIGDRKVLSAMREVPRHEFVPVAFRERAYDDSPLQIGNGQTISQPYMVAWMTQLLCLKGDEVVLEIGTGSGYQAAILSRIARKVYSVERIPALAESARERLEEHGYDNVGVVVGDGSKGLPEHAPYQGIIVTAGAPKVPPLLLEQLADGARLVVPVGPTSVQMLTVIERAGDKFVTRDEGSCVFVPLVGRDGWSGSSA